MNKRSQEATRSIKNTNVPQIVIEPGKYTYIMYFEFYNLFSIETNINEEPLLSAPSTD